jgi:hypothetical protein
MRERKRRRLEMQRQEVATRRAGKSGGDDDAAASEEPTDALNEGSGSDESGDEVEQSESDISVADDVEPEGDPEGEPQPEGEPEPAGEAEPKGEPDSEEEPEEPAKVEAKLAAPDEREQKPEVEQVDLDALGRELEKSLGRSEDVPAVAAPPPPGINATPEDILGVPTQRVTSEVEKPPEPVPDSRAASDVLKTAGGPPPMDEYEERAAMAKEVLRATSDQPKSARKQQRENAEGSDAPASDDEEQEPAEENEQNVRFSEDLTISSKKRRKLFGR